MRNLGLLVLIPAVLLGGLACRIGPSQPYPARDRFGVIATGVDAVQGSPRGTLRLERLRVAPPFDQRSFVYRTGELTFEIDYFNQFVAAPADLLTAEVFAGLKGSGRFERVVPPEILLDTPHRLEVTVTRLEGDFRNTSRPVASIALRVILLEVSGSGTRILAQDVIEETQPIPAATAKNLSEGWGKALGRAINVLGEWAGANLLK